MLCIEAEACSASSQSTDTGPASLSKYIWSIREFGIIRGWNQLDSFTSSATVNALVVSRYDVVSFTAQASLPAGQSQSIRTACTS